MNATKGSDANHHRPLFCPPPLTSSPPTFSPPHLPPSYTSPSISSGPGPAALPAPVDVNELGYALVLGRPQAPAQTVIIPSTFKPCSDIVCKTPSFLPKHLL